MVANSNTLESLQRVLRLTYGFVPLVAGLDKFFNVLTRWEQYVSPSVAQLLPFSTSTLMHFVGVIEIVAGIVVLSQLTKLGAYVVSAWLTSIALSLIASGQYLDVAVRDLVMAVGAYSLGALSSLLEGSQSRAASYSEKEFPASA